MEPTPVGSGRHRQSRPDDPRKIRWMWIRIVVGGGARKPESGAVVRWMIVRFWDGWLSNLVLVVESWRIGFTMICIPLSMVRGPSRRWVTGDHLVVVAGANRPMRVSAPQLQGQVHRARHPHNHTASHSQILRHPPAARKNCCPERESVCAKVDLLLWAVVVIVDRRLRVQDSRIVVVLVFVQCYKAPFGRHRRSVRQTQSVW